MQPDTHDNLQAMKKLKRIDAESYRGSGICIQMTNLSGEEIVNRFSISDTEIEQVKQLMMQCLRGRLLSLKDMHQMYVDQIEEQTK